MLRSAAVPTQRFAVSAAKNRSKTYPDVALGAPHTAFRRPGQGSALETLRHRQPVSLSIRDWKAALDRFNHSARGGRPSSVSRTPAAQNAAPAQDRLRPGMLNSGSYVGEKPRSKRIASQLRELCADIYGAWHQVRHQPMPGPGRGWKPN